MTHSRDQNLAPLHRLMVFAQSVHVHRMIAEVTSEPKQTFWIMTVNLLNETAAMEWCKVFGSWNEDTHWTQVVLKEQHDDVREGLLKAVGQSQEDWENYRNSILSYRDQMIAHHDLDATIDKYPHYDGALLAANFIFDQLRKRADQNYLGGIPVSLDTWSRLVARNMSTIVRKAFNASAELGSNVPRRSTT